MKKYVMKYLIFNCRDATFLMSKKEEGKLTLVEKMKLSMHISMCSFCRKFEKQTYEIGKESRHVHAEDNLSVIAKEKIKQMLEKK